MQYLTLVIPGHVLEKLSEIALAYQREEKVRVYVLRRMWFVLPLVVIFGLLSGTGLLHSGVVVIRLIDPPPGNLLRGCVFLSAMAVWLVAVMLQFSVLLYWFAKHALGGETLNRNSVEYQSSSSGRRTSALSLILLSVFVVAPLLGLAVIFPPAAVVTVIVIAFAPVIYTMFDR